MNLKGITKLTLTTTFLLFSMTVSSASLLSNFNSNVYGTYGGLPDAANPISTGSSPLQIGSISLKWGEVRPNPGFNSIGIYEDNLGEPGDVQVGTLFTNPNPTSLGDMRYVGQAVLNADTQYWVVIDINDLSRPSFTGKNEVISDESTEGATILEGAVYGDIKSGEWDSDAVSILIELDALIFANGFD